MKEQMLMTPVSNEEAAAFVASKSPVLRSVFDRMLPEIKARAICVSGLQDADAVQRVRDAIAEIPRGGDWDEAKDAVMQELSPWMVTSADPDEMAGQLDAASARAELLLRTHGFEAYASARHRAQFDPMSASGFLKYVTEGDDRVRESHAALDGIILPKDDPFWATHYPPWDWGCRCQAIEVEDNEVAQIAKDEESDPPDRRSVLTGHSQKMLSTSQRIVRDGRSISVARREDGPGSFSWKPQDLSVPLESIMQRYDPEVADAFKTAMSRAMVPGLGPDGREMSVLEFLESKA